MGEEGCFFSGCPDERGRLRAVFSAHKTAVGDQPSVEEMLGEEEQEGIEKSNPNNT